MHHTRAGHTENWRDGFTLLEVIVVIFILALTAMVVFPRLDIAGDRNKTEARHMAALLRLTNESAAARKELQSIKFDFTKKTVTATVDEGKEKSFDRIKGVEIPSRGRVSEGELTIFFGPMGAYEQVWVYIADGKKGEGYTVTLNPTSGRVKIIEAAKG